MNSSHQRGGKRLSCLHFTSTTLHVGAAEGHTSSLLVCTCITELRTELLAETANGKAACVSLGLGSRDSRYTKAGLQQPGRLSLLLFSSKECSKNYSHFCLSTQVSLSYVHQVPPNITQRLKFQGLLLFTIVPITG